MSTIDAYVALPRTQTEGSRSGFGRLVGAELLKLRRRRGLMALTAALTILPMLVAYVVMIVVHQTNAAENGPAGGIENLGNSVDMLSIFAVVAGILIGATAGAGDLGAGVFRELVTTGRDRRALFAARVPAGLAVLLAMVLSSFGIAAVVSVTLNGSLAAPSASTLLAGAGWITLVASASFVLSLSISSATGSRSTAIGGLLAWQLAISPLLLGATFLGAAREGIPLNATELLRPDTIGVPGDIQGSTAVALATMGVWLVVPLAIGMWRTVTRDA